MGVHRVIVIYGGPHEDHDISVQTGKSIVEALEGHKVHEVYIDANSDWFHQGIQRDAHHHLHHGDVVVVGLHTPGEVQQFLDTWQKPYTGSTAHASSIASNPILSKEILKRAGIKTPKVLIIPPTLDVLQSVRFVFEKMGVPILIQPTGEGTTKAPFLARDYTELAGAIEEGRKISPFLLAQEYITGTRASCSTVEGLRGQSLYTPPPTEIRTEGTVCPGYFDRKMTGELEEATRKAHSALGLRHYSSSEFIIHPLRGLFYLGTDTHPPLGTSSMLPESLLVVGISQTEFIEHLIRLALGKEL